MWDNNHLQPKELLHDTAYGTHAKENYIKQNPKRAHSPGDCEEIGTFKEDIVFVPLRRYLGSASLQEPVYNDEAMPCM